MPHQKATGVENGVLDTGAALASFIRKEHISLSSSPAYHVFKSSPLLLNVMSENGIVFG